MADWKKIIVGTGIGAGIIGAIAYFSRLNRTNAELETVATAKLHSLKLDGLTVRIDVKIKNPTNNSFKIKFPFVKLLYKDKTIGTSQVVNKDITIPEYGEAVVEAIMVKIPVTGLLSLGGGLFSLLSKNQAVTIAVKTITTIDLGWKQMPYEKTDNSTLNPAG